MKRRFLIVCSLISLALLAALGARAQEIPCPVPICPPDSICDPVPCLPPWGVSTNPDWLVIAHHRVDVRISDQIARTTVDFKFENRGDGLAEGTFIFPLPAGAAVDSLTMFINDTAVQARVLDADEARAYYDAIVRQYRDPALLEFLGTTAVQANVFPIPPGETRRIELTYSQALTLENGLVHYVYPLHVSQLTSRRPAEEMVIRVAVESAGTIGTVYSPSHAIAIAREGESTFRAGFEASDFNADRDFSLYYGVSGGELSLNLLSYRAGANEDGYFLMLLQPPLQAEAQQVLPRDVLLVLDQSGSMQGEKWAQAQAAARYVLQHLNPGDRFNAVLFSTGWRMFSERWETPQVAEEAAAWIDGQFAEGGTNIDGALSTALQQVDPERRAVLLFMTDGLPTEGELDSQTILRDLQQAAPGNAQIFTFGVGDDVDTYLLDSISAAFDGASSYVRPGERIDEEMAALYQRISAPVLRDATLTVEGVQIDAIYPVLPIDLFAGSQVVLAGRYRGAADDARIMLSGEVDGQRRDFIFAGQAFRARAGGEAFVGQLWATRRIGDLLTQIRLHGENREWVDSIIALSVRFGIITPYTSFLLDENDILTQTGRQAAAQSFEAAAQSLANTTSGASAVDAADMSSGMAAAAAPLPAPTAPAGQPTPSGGFRTAAGKTFVLQDGVWTDTRFDASTMTAQTVVFASDDYFALLQAEPALAPYFALGEQVIIVRDDGTALRVTAA